MSLSGKGAHFGSEVSHNIFKYKFPYRSERNYNELRELEKKYKKWVIISIILAVGLLLLLPVPYAYLLHFIYAHIYSLINESGSYSAWWGTFGISGLLLTLGTLIWVVEGIQRILLYPNYDEFEDYYNHQQEYDNHKAGVLIGNIFLVLTLISLPFAFGQKLVLLEKTVTIKPIYYLAGKEYNYTDITSIVRYASSEDKNGKIAPDRNYMICFADGNKFNPATYFGDGDASEPFIRYLVSRSEKSIDDREVYYYKDK